MKYYRIKKNKEFQKIFSRGKRVFSPCITLLYFESDRLELGIAVSKKHGKAHIRNRIKRLVRASFFEESDRLKKNYSIIAVPKVAEEYSFKEFKKSFYICFKKMESLKKHE